MFRRFTLAFAAASLAAIGLTVPSAHAAPFPVPTQPATTSGMVGGTASDVPPIDIRTGREATGSSTTATGTADAANTYVNGSFNDPGSHPYVGMRSQFLTDPPAQDNAGYFNMNAFWWSNGDPYGGYIGLQTRLGMPGFDNVGHGAIFTIWGAVAVDTSTCVCTAVSGSELGRPFLSIHMPFNWVAGRAYEVRIARGHVGDGMNQRVDALLIDLATGAGYSMGALGVPANWGGLATTVSRTMEEYFPSAYNWCGDILRTTTLWGGIVGLTTTQGVELGPFQQVGTIQQTVCTTWSGVINLGAGAWRGRIGGTS